MVAFNFVSVAFNVVGSLASVEFNGLKKILMAVLSDSDCGLLHLGTFTLCFISFENSYIL